LPRTEHEIHKSKPTSWIDNTVAIKLTTEDPFVMVSGTVFNDNDVESLKLMGINWTLNPKEP